MRMDREISPPPVKRRKVHASDVVKEHASRGAPGEGFKPDSMSLITHRFFRIFSWNVNGIQPFLPASDASITAFFKPVSQTERPDKRLTFPRVTNTQSNPSGNPLRAFLQRHRWPEVVFLQELKISPSDKKTPPALLSAVNSSLGKDDKSTPETRYVLDVNLPRDKHNARGFGGKLYGVGTLLREDFSSQYLVNIRHAAWDLEGRVTIVEISQEQTDIAIDPIQPTAPTANANSIKLSSERPLALLNIYAVNGTTAPYRSPKTGKVSGTRHDHKLAFHTRLRDECLDLENRGFSVVLAGDLNIARGRLDGHPNLRTYPRQHCVNRADFNAKFFCDEDNARAEAYTGDVPLGASEAKFHGVDVFRALRGKERRYTYHPRGGDDWGSSCDRVDFIVVSKELFDASRVLETDILDSPPDRGTSDHVPLWVKVRLDNHGSGTGDSTRCVQGESPV